MKSLHFCTPQKLEELQNNNVFYTVRTGFVPTFFEGETINITNYHTKAILCKATVQSIIPLQFVKIKDNPQNQEEIARYHRKFDDRQWFFKILLFKIEKEGPA